MVPVGGAEMGIWGLLEGREEQSGGSRGMMGGCSMRGWDSGPESQWPQLLVQQAPTLSGLATESTTAVSEPS